MKKNFDDIMDVVGGQRKRVYVGFVMDHSGSMLSERENALKGFNDQILKIKEESDSVDTFVTVIEFDDQAKILFKNTNVTDIPLQETYWIGGSTALYDSIAKCISLIQQDFDAFSGDKAVLLFIETDGQENLSTEFKGEDGRLKINKMIKELEDSGKWTITFLGQRIDQEYAADLGFAAMNTMSFNNRDYANRVVVNSIHTYYSTIKETDTRGVKGLMEAAVTETQSQGYADEEKK